MKQFSHMQVREAVQHSLAGGQALHLMPGFYGDLNAKAPRCFKKRKELAHLFDQDAARLAKTAKRLGVRVIKIEYFKTDRQHIDLCGAPLERAKAITSQDDFEQAHNLL